MTTRIVTLIFTDEDLRGNGTEESMFRRIPKLFTLDGRLVCEFDYGEAPGAGTGTVNATVLAGLDQENP
jgi:hypothetical protein